jgi:signal transduction histidine kinase
MKAVSPKKRLILLSGFLIAFLLVLNVSTYILYTRAKDYLDTELGERLRSIAVALSHTVEISTNGPPRATDISPKLHRLLHAARTENLLSNIVILTPAGSTVLDLANVTVEGEPNPFIELDFSAVMLARSGLSAYTNLYRFDDMYMKSAYAPITSGENEVVGILGVEAGATYFDVLRALKGAIIAVDVASVLIIIVLGVVFYHQSLSLDHAQAAVIQSENLATMGRMVAGIAHEIRNPMSIIGTSAERLQKKYGSDDEVFSYITEEVDRLNEILTGYLNFAKARSQTFRPHSLQRIVGRCIMILDPEILAKSLEVVNRLPDQDVMISSDDKRLQQAILNILLNAIQALPDRGTIEISLDAHPKYAIVVVKDNGDGIARKNLKEVTKPFFTTKKHGSGLGMSIVSTIVEEHGGNLAIESAPGAGTKVLMSIPLAPQS